LAIGFGLIIAAAESAARTIANKKAQPFT